MSGMGVGYRLPVTVFNRKVKNLRFYGSGGMGGLKISQDFVLKWVTGNR